MADEIVTISKWIPVIGTLSGAALGFFASFGTAWFNQKNIERINKEDRERQRLEDIYRTLIVIRKDFSKRLTQSVSKLKHNQEIPSEPNYEIAPLVKLEMLVNLYTPQLKDIHADFQKTIYAFGKEYIKLHIENISAESPQNKQALLNKIFALYEEVDNKADAMQKDIPRLIKA